MPKAGAAAVTSGDPVKPESSTLSVFAKIRNGNFLKHKTKNKNAVAAKAALDHLENGIAIYSEPKTVQSELPPLPTNQELKIASKVTSGGFVAPVVLHDSGDALQQVFLKHVEANKKLAKDDGSSAEEEDDEDWDAPPAEEEQEECDDDAVQEEAAVAKRVAQDADLAKQAAKKAQQRSKRYKGHRKKEQQQQHVAAPKSKRMTTLLPTKVATPRSQIATSSPRPPKAKPAKIPVGFVPTLPGESNAKDFKPKISEAEHKYISVGDSCVCIGVGGNKNVSSWLATPDVTPVVTISESMLLTVLCRSTSFFPADARHCEVFRSCLLCPRNLDWC